MEMPCIMGNHDEYCAVDTDLSGFNPHAGHAIMWTRDQLSDEERDWLKRLKYLRMIANFPIVHSTLDAPKRWGYVMSKLDAAASFTYQNTGVCFFGHTHVPLAFMRDQNTVIGGKYDSLEVEKGKKYFINVGSVGQPRDGDSRAAYVIYDLKAGTIELRRLEYDFKKTQAKILEAGLPERLANRLALEPQHGLEELSHLGPIYKSQSDYLSLSPIHLEVHYKYVPKGEDKEWKGVSTAL